MKSFAVAFLLSTALYATLAAPSPADSSSSLSSKFVKRDVPDGTTCGNNYYTSDDINTAINAAQQDAASGDLPDNCKIFFFLRKKNHTDIFQRSS